MSKLLAQFNVEGCRYHVNGVDPLWRLNSGVTNYPTDVPTPRQSWSDPWTYSDHNGYNIGGNITYDITKQLALRAGMLYGNNTASSIYEFNYIGQRAWGEHEVLRWVIVTLVALIVAAQVAVSGGVGWVGLIIPHMARMLVGAEHRKLPPVAALLGGIYLLGMDDIARSIGHQEVPIGLLTAVVGAPCFGFMFWKTQGNGWERE